MLKELLADGSNIEFTPNYNLKKSDYCKSHDVDYDLMFTMLKDIKEVFHEYHVRWCLFGGTLIGAVRDGDFPLMPVKKTIKEKITDEDGKEIEIEKEIDEKIYTDFDIDIIVLNMQIDQLKAVLGCFSALGYLVALNNLKPFVIAKGKEWTDFWCFNRTRRNYYTCGGVPFHKKFFPYYLGVKNIKDCEVYVPDHAEEFLDLYYTPSWRTPAKSPGQFLDNSSLLKRLQDRYEKGI